MDPRSLFCPVWHELEVDIPPALVYHVCMPVIEQRSSLLLCGNGEKSRVIFKTGSTFLLNTLQFSKLLHSSEEVSFFGNDWLKVEQLHPLCVTPELLYPGLQRLILGDTRQ